VLKLFGINLGRVFSIPARHDLLHLMWKTWNVVHEARPELYWKPLGMNWTIQIIW